MISFEKLHIKYGISSIKLVVENFNIPIYKIIFLNGNILKINISKHLETEQDVFSFLEKELKKELKKNKKTKNR